MKKRLGVALVTSMLVSVLLLILGLSFLHFLETDYRFAGRQEKAQEAYYLALGGLQAQRTRPDLFSSTPFRYQIPPGDTEHFAEVSVVNGKITSRGVVKSSIFVLAERTLVVDPGKSSREFHDPTL